MKNSRRKFLRNTSIAGTSLMLLNIQNKNKQRDIISCAADDEVLSLTGTISSAKSGAWSDKATWSGGKVPGSSDTPLISKGHTVTFDVTQTTVAGVNVAGTLLFSNSKSTTLQSKRNVVVNGLLKMYPDSASVVQTLRFIEINETAVVGGGMDPIDSDIGLWVMGAGKLDISGTKKKSWTRASESIKAGRNSFSVNDVTGWNIGDEIMIVPTEKPAFKTQDWDDKTGTLIDSFLPKFERRTIKSISGKTITLSSALNYDHLSVSSTVTSSKLGSSTRNWNAEVANLTRNVRIEGTKDSGSDSYKAYHRAHIFIRSTSPQNIQFLQARYLGPRKLQGGARPMGILGRYGLHFHCCGDGSVGSQVIGCSFFEMGHKVYVPHMSNNIVMNKNIAFDALGEAFWYDFQAPTHYCTWNQNLMAAIRLDGVRGISIGMELGQGDGNEAKGNVAVFAGCGDLHSGGSYDWMADNEGVWIFENNMCHSTNTGTFSWQNSNYNHTILNYNSYNCEEGIALGAYGNSYMYKNGHHYNSKIFNIATAGNTAAVAFIKLFVDGGNQLTYCARVEDSPAAPGYERTNKFINCVFRNYKNEVIQIASSMQDSNPEKQWKYVDLIECDFTSSVGYALIDNDLYPLKNNTRARVQTFGGAAYQTIRQSNNNLKNSVSRFAPSVWGDGLGLTANYYNGANFNNLAFTRVDSMVMFDQWSVDAKASPNGVHHLITGEAFSIRWTGQIEAQFSESYIFYLQGSGGFRLWIDGKQIINDWYDRTDRADIVTSSAIKLNAGTKYDIKMEFMNMAGDKNCLFYWKCPSLLTMSNVPMTQLYPTGYSLAAARQEDANAQTNEENALQVTVSPNPSPTNFKVHFKSTSNSPISLKVYSKNGISQGVFNNIQNNATLTVGDRLPRGDYYAIVIQDGKSQMIKFLKL